MTEQKIDFNKNLINSPKEEEKIKFNQQQNSVQQSQNHPNPYKNLLHLIQTSQHDRLRAFLSTQSEKYALLNQKDKALHQHCLYNSVCLKDKAQAFRITELLVKNGANIKTTDMHGQSPLFYIAKEGNVQILHLFLTFSIDLNETDHFKQTPLFYAAREGHCECIREMLKNGANPNHKDKINQTALFYAARDGKGAVCRVLVEFGANVNEVDMKKQTALYFAKKFKKEECVKVLLELGAINTKDGRVTKSDMNKIKKKSQRSLKSESRVAPKKKKKDSHKVSYKLVFTKTDLSNEDIRESDFLNTFKKSFPNISHLLLHPEILDNNKNINEQIEKDNWQTVAHKILSHLWKIKGANIFHNPVDFVKLNIPDYPEIVKKPMDFGTIKKKINSNVYLKPREFFEDMELVFYNCKLYNGTEGYVGECGVNVGKQFRTYLENYKFFERFESEEMDFEEFLKTQFGQVGGGSNVHGGKEKKVHFEEKKVDFVEEKKTDFVEENKVDFVEENKINVVGDKKMDVVENIKVDVVGDKKIDFVGENKIDVVEEKKTDFIEENKVDVVEEKKNDFIEEKKNNFIEEKVEALEKEGMVIEPEVEKVVVEEQKDIVQEEINLIGNKNNENNPENKVEPEIEKMEENLQNNVEIKEQIIQNNPSGITDLKKTQENENIKTEENKDNKLLVIENNQLNPEKESNNDLSKNLEEQKNLLSTNCNPEIKEEKAETPFNNN